MQAAVQLLFFIGNDAWASDLRTKEILELVGCPKALSGLDLFLVRPARQLSWDTGIMLNCLNGIGSLKQQHMWHAAFWCWQDLFPPLFALVAASAEVNAARGAVTGQQMGLTMPRLRQSMASLANLDSTGSQVYYALMWAAGDHLPTPTAHATLGVMQMPLSCLSFACTQLHMHVCVQ